MVVKYGKDRNILPVIVPETVYHSMYDIYHLVYTWCSPHIFTDLTLFSKAKSSALVATYIAWKTALVNS